MPSTETHHRRPHARRARMPAGFALAALAVLALGALAGCRREEATSGPAPDSPAAAVQSLVGHLRAGDLSAYARDAVPPDLHGELEAAWREDRSRWPLSELPMGGRISPLLAAFSAEGAEARLQAAFDQQFAGSERELDAAAQSLALFGTEYVRSEGDFSDAERLHYARVIEAIGAWAMDAPLAEPARARTSIARLSAAARATGLDEPADFTSLGMTGSLDRLKPFVAAGKRTLADYGLDLDASLAALRAEPVSQSGNEAVVLVRYPLAGTEVETELAMERVDGRWYPVDSMRNARESLDAPPPTAGEPAAEAAAAP